MTTKIYLSKENAEMLAEKIRQELPEIKVNLSNCTNPVNKEVIGWFLGLFVGDSCIVAVDDEQDYEQLKNFCSYVVTTLSANEVTSMDSEFLL